MKLGIFLPLGESFRDMANHGQDVRFVKIYLSHYVKHFDQVTVFSYENEKYKLPFGVKLITPGSSLHRYLYALFLPVIHWEQIKDIDVFRCLHPSSTLPAWGAKLLFGKKFIFNYNYDYSKWAVMEDKALLVPFLKITEHVSFLLSDHIFVSDEKMHSYVARFVSKKKITLIRNAADPNLFPYKAQPQNKKIQIMSIGRLEKQKNYGQLIEALGLLAKYDLKLIIIGKGSLKRELVKLASKQKVALQIIPSVPNDKLPKYLEKVHVYAQPSLMEAPVKTLLEAMSTGRACVATDVAGIRDVIINNKNGLLARLDTNDLASKIEQLIKKPSLRARLGKEARKTIEKKYDINHYLNLEVKRLKQI